jgi:hypothetical protein
MARFTGITGGGEGTVGPTGPAGPEGPQGPAGADGDPLDFLAVPSNIVPDTDNAYTLGTAENRWAGIHVGPGTIYITDTVTDEDTELTVTDGVLQIDGANQLKVGQLRFVDNTIESTSGDTDIQIGLLESTADVVVNRDLVLGTDKTITFPDNTVQTTAYTGGGSSADIADFTFTFEGSEANEDALSKIAISNHDMSIQTTRDDEQDADITLDSADDVFIIANGDDIHLDAADDVNITTNINGDVQYAWEFDNSGNFIFPDFSEQTTAYIPTVETSFTVVGGTLGDAPTFTGDPLFTGSYVKTGPMVHFQIQVDMDNITSFGTGQYYMDLPFPAKYPYKFRDGCLHDISATKDYAISGHVAAGESRLYLFSTDTQSGKVFDIVFDHNGPITLSTADNFHIAGDYIISDTD